MPPPPAPPPKPITSSAPHWTWLPLARGAPAESSARSWLAAQLGAAGDLPITRDARGRPRLGAPLADYDCNWSHSGQRLLVALGRGLQVGIDCERLRPRPRALEVARRYFDAREAAWLAAQPAATRDRAFLRLWCAKEALLKAHGHGLAFGLDRLRFVERGDRLRLVDCDPALGRAQDWQLRELAPSAGYLGALAWRSTAP